MVKTVKIALVTSLVVALGILVGTGDVAAKETGSCTTVADVGSKIWDKAGPTVKSALASSGPFGASAEKAIKMIEKGIKIWNKLAGDKSWAKIGPRRMDYGEWNYGTLIGPTERMFLSGIPAVNPATSSP